MSLIFIGTPTFAVPSLRGLATAGHEISAVITQPDRPAGRGRHSMPSPVKVAAVELGLPIIQPESLRDANTLDQLRRLSPEVMVAVAYGQILSRNVLEIPQRGVLNLHPSLLPRYRGASPIPAAILAGNDETGITIMLMDEGMDTGPVLAQTQVPISPQDTAGSLAESLAELGAHLLVETLPKWLTGRITPQPQDSSAATVTRPLKKEDGAIDWLLPAVETCCRVRAYNPWPGAYTRLNGELVHIWSAWPLDGASGTSPGTVVAVPPVVPAEAKAAAFAVQTGSGLLAVLEAQRSGRKRLPSPELLRGIPSLIGKRLSAL